MLWTTEIRAVDPWTGELLTWCGPNVPGVSAADAERHCQQNGLGYCEVTGMLVCEVDAETGERAVQPYFN